MEESKERLEPDRVKAGLTTKRFGRNIIYQETTSSAMDLAKKEALAGATEGTIVLVEEQTAGRGRMGRIWLAPPFSSILASVIFRPNLIPSQSFRLTMLCGVAAAMAVRETTGLDCRIKWPNDLTIGGKKLAGILAEASIAGDRLEFVIVGIGLNVNMSFADLPELAGQAPSSLSIPRRTGQATSLSEQLGHPISRLYLLQRLLWQIEGWHDYLEPPPTLSEEEPKVDKTLRAEDRLYKQWRELLVNIGQPVTVDWGDRQEEGLALDVGAEGSLLFQGASGKVMKITAGDVNLRQV